MKNLTPREFEVMTVLWKGGALKPAEIEQNFPRPIRNAALRSVLLLLLEKGHVKRKKIGKAYYYKAKTPPSGEFARRVRRLAKAFFRGSPAALIAQLIKNEKLSDQDIRELKKIVEEKTSLIKQGGD